MAEFHEAVREIGGSVAVDLHESEDAYLIVADLPGATEETTEIDATVEALRVRTHRGIDPPSGGMVIRQERPEVLEFELPMPGDAKAASAEASLAKGVLEIRIPRGPVETEIPITEE